MKMNGNEIRQGNIIKHQDTIWVAVKCNAVKPGKGGAFNQVELKNLLDGRKLNERFRAAETVERVRLEQKTHTYLYEDGNFLVFMNGETYEQIIILEVQDTEPVVKGQTAANSFKPATMENGVRTNVPPFVGVGEKLVINTEDGSYVKRAD